MSRDRNIFIFTVLGRRCTHQRQHQLQHIWSFSHSKGRRSRESSNYGKICSIWRTSGHNTNHNQWQYDVCEWVILQTDTSFFGTVLTCTVPIFFCNLQTISSEFSQVFIIITASLAQNIFNRASVTNSPKDPRNFLRSSWKLLKVSFETFLTSLITNFLKCSRKFLGVSVQFSKIFYKIMNFTRNLFDHEWILNLIHRIFLIVDLSRVHCFLKILVFSALFLRIREKNTG